jgi:cytochrome c peroxidase
MCGQCHGGANLNQVTLLGAAGGNSGLAVASKFANVLVSETNSNNDPMYIFRVDNGAGDVRQVISPDTGIMLTQRKNSRHLNNYLGPNVHPATLVGMFKTRSLWGVKNTPPYFHDNSAKTLRDVVDHYADRCSSNSSVAYSSPWRNRIARTSWRTSSCTSARQRFADRVQRTSVAERLTTNQADTR